MLLSEIEGCSFSRDGFKPHVKSPVIWGHKGCECFPLCYLTKPKYMTDIEWNSFLDGFNFTLKKPENETAIDNSMQSGV
jgi:hypothetical protein